VGFGGVGANESRLRKDAGEQMADIDITQAEADALIEMEKRFIDSDDWFFSGCGTAELP
jgi:hypothetical protein